MHHCRSLLVLFGLLSLVCAADNTNGRPTRPPTRAVERRFHKYVTRPDIDAPVWHIRKPIESAISPGYWFVAFYQGLDQKGPGESWLGPHIYDGNGELVWAGGTAFKHFNVFDFGMEHELAGDRLTLLSDHEKTAYILNSTYQIEHEVPLVIDGEVKPNMHSFHVIDEGKRALILNIRPWNTTKEVSAQVGFNGSCFAKYQGFRELNLETPDSRPIFEWDAKDHIGLEESTFRKYEGNVSEMCTKGWDILHLNSIDKFPDGDYLLSARHTNTLYKISHVDGSIVWRLGGAKSDFEFLGQSQFTRQHHGRVQSQNETHTIITVFDNAIGDGYHERPSHDWSRGLVLSVDTVNMKVELIQEYLHPEGRLVNARGSFQTLPNDNAFLCWAYSSLISEHTPDGQVALEAFLDVKAHTYRAFKFPWVGRPVQRPDVATEAIWNGPNILTQIHVSWNGATEVARWTVHEVNESGMVRTLKSARREGFETTIRYEGYAKNIFVEGFDRRGNSLGRSEIVLTAPPVAMGLEVEPEEVKEAGSVEQPEEQKEAEVGEPDVLDAEIDEAEKDAHRVEAANEEAEKQEVEEAAENEEAQEEEAELEAETKDVEEHLSSDFDDHPPYWPTESTTPQADDIPSTPARAVFHNPVISFLSGALAMLATLVLGTFILRASRRRRRPVWDRQEEKYDLLQDDQIDEQEALYQPKR